MSIRVNSPSQSTLSALRNSQTSRKEMQKTMEKLSSGLKTNRASDDAAGLAIAQELSQALRGLEQGMENVYDGLSVIQVADGGMDQMGENLHRMRELAMTSANGTISPEQRDAVQAEFDTLKAEVTRIAESTEFNGKTLLDGSAGSMDIALGTDGGGVPDTIEMDLSTSMDATSLGLATTSVDGADGSNALSAMDDIDAALARVSSQRADLGATSNRLMSAGQGMAVSMENTYAARSRLIDTDYALETSRLTAQQIQNQASTAVQIQSHGIAATALNLLK